MGLSVPLVVFALRRRFSTAGRKQPAPTAPKGSTVATGRRYRGMPVPFFFLEQSAERFHGMETKADDVFLTSLAKGGTTWVNKILWSMLHGFDANGNETPVSQPGTSPHMHACNFLV